MNKELSVFAVVGNYNSWELTSSSIQELNEAGFCDENIILVDDGSTDDSAWQLKNKFPNCNHMQKKLNQGYCKAFNSGFKRAIELGADIIFWAQNDSHTYSKNFVSRAVQVFERDSNLGLLGTQIFTPDGRVRWCSAPKNRMGIEYNISEGFFVSAEAFMKTGGLDERFGVYFEDIDFFQRVKSAGFSTKVVDDISWVHIAGATLRRKIFEPAYLRTKNLFLIVKLHSFHNRVGWIIRIILGETRSHINVTRRVHNLSLLGYLKLFSGITLGFLIGIYYFLGVSQYKSDNLND